MRTDALVGGIVVCAVVIAAGLWVWMQGYVGTRGTYDIVLCAADSQGITEGQPVTVAGVQVGKVLRVGLEDHGFRDKPAAIHLLIKDQGDTPGALRLHDRFRIESGALLGEKYVRVEAGPAPRGRRLRNGDVVAAQAGPPSIADITTGTKELIDTLTSVATKLDKGLGREDEWASQVSGMLENLTEASREAREVAGSLRGMVRRADLRVDSMLDNLDATTANFRLASGSLNEFVVTTSIPRDAEAAVATARQATERIEHLASRLDEIVASEENARSIKETIANVRDASENVAKVAGKASEIADRGREVMETATEVSENALTISENLADASKDGKEAAAHANNIMARWDRRMAGTEDRLRKIEVQPRLELTFGFESADFQLDADLFFRRRGSDSQVVVGLRDFGGRTDLNLQYAKWLNAQRRVRMGLIGGDLGAALDEDLKGPWSVTLEAYDQARLRVDVTGARELRPGTHLLFGADDAFHRVDPFLGLRTEW